MRSRSEEFRANAAKCQELANCWRDEGKRQYGELARQWLQLAEQSEGQLSEQRRSRHQRRYDDVAEREVTREGHDEARIGNDGRSSVGCCGHLRWLRRPI
jgi:hypothetical protein